MSDIANTPDGAGLLQAASRNIDNLQHAVHDLEKAAGAAKKAAESAVTEARRWRFLTIILGFFVIVAMVASGLSVYNWVKATDATSQLRTQAITSCEEGNQRAAGIVTALDELVTLLEGPKPTPEIIAAGDRYEAFVLKNNAPRDCTKAYSSAQATG